MTKPLVYLVFGDVHLHHQNTPTSHILESFDIFFEGYGSKSKMAQVDVIFLAGDLFHRLMYYNHEDTSLISNWARTLVEFCLKNRILLRVLKGTPSHDYDQLDRLFTPYEKEYGSEKVRYISLVDVEILPTGHSVLYIPDEAHSSAAETLTVVDEIYKARHIDAVDIAIMHGAFDYQLPKSIPDGVKVKLHVPSEYLKRVKGFISINHIHIASVYERIVAPGSFDRTAQGEEKPKGAVVFTHDPDSGSHFLFVENKNAHIYKRVVIKSPVTTTCIEQIDKELAGLPDNSMIEIRGPKGHPLFTNFEQLQLRYLNLRLNKDPVLVSLDGEEIEVKEELFYQPLQIHRENILELIMKEMSSKNLDRFVMSKAQTLIGELL